MARASLRGTTAAWWRCWCTRTWSWCGWPPSWTTCRPWRCAPARLCLARTPRRSCGLQPGWTGFACPRATGSMGWSCAQTRTGARSSTTQAWTASGGWSSRRLRITGSVRIMAAGIVRSGQVEAHEIDIVVADARGFDERPAGFGVEMVPGVFILWNRQADPAATITAVLTGLSMGRAGSPVRGGGVFVAGAGAGAAAGFWSRVSKPARCRAMAGLHPERRIGSRAACSRSPAPSPTRCATAVR